ncbi:MAG: cupredoxin domain-containing protein, partial [Myxococcales bacterium]|nr:cupredoxin domain-containing protein [Myxococcales bacterium]
PASIEALIVGGLFSLFFAWWVIGFRQYVRARVAPENSYDIYVSAKQWMWKFAYPEGSRSIAQLYVPAGRPVKLIMSSRDVIHSFYVPDFRLKQDVLPGRYTTLWFTVKEPGTHQIFCAEYCGTNHSTMRGEVIALDPADFGKWLAANGGDDTTTPPPPDRDPSLALELGRSRPMSLVRLGQEVSAQQGCLRCHTLDGTPHIGPTWAGLFGASVALADGSRVTVDEAYLTESMMDPLAHIRAGYQPVMPSYLGRLHPAETAAIVALIKSLAGVAGQEPTQPTPPATATTPPAGALGQPSGRNELAPLQPVPSQPGTPPPSQQGLPPPGAPLMPPLQGDVRVGPDGQAKGVNR